MFSTAFHVFSSFSLFFTVFYCILHLFSLFFIDTAILAGDVAKLEATLRAVGQFSMEKSGFPLKNPGFLFRNPGFLFRNPDSLLKNVVIKQVGTQRYYIFTIKHDEFCLQNDELCIQKLAGARVEGQPRYLLHYATGWPGMRPNTAAVIQCLVRFSIDFRSIFGWFLAGFRLS